METVSKIESMEAFEALASEWNGLLTENDTNNVFLTHEWVRSWWQAFHHQHSLYILAIRDDRKLVGLAPLMLTRTGFLGRKSRIIRFIGTPNADYADIIGPDKKKLVGLVCACLEAHRDEWDRVELSQIGQASATTAAFRDVLTQNRSRFEIKEIETCMAYVYEGPEDKRTAFQLPRKTTLKRSMKHLDEAGGLTLEQIDDPEKILAHLPAFFHAHIVRWEGTATPSKFNKPAFRAFYENLVKNLGPAGYISFKILRHQDRPIAWFFTYRYNNTAYLYTLVHNRFYSKHSPGNILITMIVDDCVRRGYAMVDHTRGARAHKGIFANREAINYRVSIFKSSGAYRRMRFYEWLKRTLPARKLAENKRWMYRKTKVYAYYADHGSAALCRAFWRKPLHPIYESKVALVLEYKGNANSPAPPRPEITVERLYPKDIGVIAAFMGFEPGTREHLAVENRFTDGGDCFAIRCNGTLASICWGLFKKDIASSRVFHLEDDEVAFADDYTSPLFRDRGLHQIGIRYRLKYYTPKNLRILALCPKEDEASQKGFLADGFVPVEKVRSLKVLGIKIR
ncbi:MAG: GNAT family N-acetyltransferase [candidate division Zixibacteria bacterium]|nr:GNAT family N-acetyltransferase [candidate division Zixibacteria bacterium]